MKKWLLTLVCLGVASTALTTVDAKELPLTGTSTVEYNNVYIVGNWVFQLNKYGANGRDLSDAASKYALLKETRDVPIYYIVGGTVYQFESKGTAAPKALGTVDKVFAGSKINALGLNETDYEDLVLEEVEPYIESKMDELATDATNHGFESITYENNTATFTISDPSKMLYEYKSQVLETLKTFVNTDDYGLVSVKYGNEVYKADQLKEDTQITDLAKKVLKNMAGENTILDYASVANKTDSIVVTYKDDKNNTYEVTYTLKFVYNFKEEKNKALGTVAEKLDGEIKTPTKEKDYGFSGVTYKDGTVTFEVFNPDAKLVDFAESGIVELFLNNYAGARKVEYTVDGKKANAIELKGENLTEAEVVKLAAEVLKFMAGKSDDTSFDAGKLTVGDVANKTATAVVTFADGSTATYTLTFNFNVEEVKDGVLDDYAKKLTEGKELIKMGFRGVTYDKSNNTVKFDISDPSQKFIGESTGDGQFTNSELVQKIAEMFNTWSTGATKVIYKVNGDTGAGTPVDFTSENRNVVQLAAQLLTAMAGTKVSSELTVGDVAGTYAYADFYFVGQEQPITYKVEFNYDVKESTYETLQGNVTGLTQFDTEGENTGYFSNINFDEATGKATFTVNSEKKSSKLSQYGARDKIIHLFDDTVVDATKISFTVNNETYTYTLGESASNEDEKNVTVTSFDGNTIAKALFTAMKKAKGTSEQEIKPSEITLEDVIGVTVTAQITYKVGVQDATTVDVSLEFVEATPTE